MKMLFKQRFFSWFDSYDIYDENGCTLFTVEGKPAWGHKLQILDANGYILGTVRQQVFRFLPHFDFYQEEQLLGTLCKEFSLFHPAFSLGFNGWQVQGSFFEWDYTITDAYGDEIAIISKELLNWTDTYSIEVHDPANALYALMIVLAIDAEKCSRN